MDNFLDHPIDEVSETWEYLAKSQVKRRKLLGWLGTFAAFSLIWVGSKSTDYLSIHESAEWLGLFLIFIAILGRIICTLYIGGRKGKELIVDGPYSVCRNPLYLFSICAVLGIGLQSGSFTIGLVFTLLAITVFRWIISKEELLLRICFKNKFDDYIISVPKIWPKFTLWRSPKTITIDLESVYKTARDALPYFFAIPYLELIEVAHTSGFIKPYLLLW